MKLVYGGLTLIFLGIILIIVASLVSAPSTISTQPSSVSGGVAGVVFIGPFPIVFGAGNPSQMPYLFTFGVIFTIIAILFFILPLILYKRSQSRF